MLPTMREGTTHVSGTIFPQNFHEATRLSSAQFSFAKSKLRSGFFIVFGRMTVVAQIRGKLTASEDERSLAHERGSSSKNQWRRRVGPGARVAGHLPAGGVCRLGIVALQARPFP